MDFPFIVIYNSDTAAHTMTAQPRAAADIAPASPPFSVPAGGYLPLPTTVFASVTDGSANGTVYAFYSDVPIQGFNPPAKAGTPAASVGWAELGQSGAVTTGSERMAGYGGSVSFTPKTTGIIEIGFCGTLAQFAVNDQILIRIRYGTGAPPAGDAAAVGTAVSLLGGSSGVQLQDIGVAAGKIYAPFRLGAIIGVGTPLSIGVAYWFDFGMQITSNGDSAFTTLEGIKELPA